MRLKTAFFPRLYGAVCLFSTIAEIVSVLFSYTLKKTYFKQITRGFLTEQSQNYKWELIILEFH